MRGRALSRPPTAHDHRWCVAPACSHRATRRYRVLFSSQPGNDRPDNEIGLCALHLRCIHLGDLKVVGKAPDGLRWFLHGEPWDGPKPAAGI